MIRVLLVASLFALAGCGGAASSAGGLTPPPPSARNGKYFAHVVIVVQENRTFDNLFATFPGADGTTIGKTHDGTLPLRKADLTSGVAPNNGYKPYWLEDYNHGEMNGFDLVPIGRTPGTYVYQYVNPAQIAPYWQLAQQYVLSDHTFQTQGSGSFTAHQDLIRGGTQITPTESLIDFPTGVPWGCDGPHGSQTSLITADDRYLQDAGPAPCLQYRTLADLLDTAQLTWRYYVPTINGRFAGDLWNAFDSISSVRYSSQWSQNVIQPETKIFNDIKRGSLASVTWVIPDFNNSDHPGGGLDTGPSWVAQVVNAIGESPAWNSTAIIVVWDDWGGWYDHVAPPGTHKFGGLGFRVPLIAVSPYAKTGYVSHKQYEFGSIVRFIEDNWDLGSLGTTDATSADFASDFFNFSQQPRSFVSIDAKYSQTYFLHQRPSNKPVDNE